LTPGGEDIEKLDREKLLRPGARLGHDVVIKDVTGSTNDDAMELAKDGAPHGLVVIADRQDKGRGRLGRKWLSPPGAGLYFSVILKDGLPPSPGLVTLAAGVAVAKALGQCSGLPARIKWPNDVRIGGKKISGILAEASGDGAVEQVILGIGVNINLAAADMVDDIKQIATSLSIETGREFDRAEVFKTMLDKLESAYDLLFVDGGKELLDEWKGLAEAMGARVKVDGPAGVFTGRVVGVTQSGALLVDDEDGGRRREVVAGDVIILE